MSKSKFFEFIIPEFSTDPDMLKSLPKHAVCICCLAKNGRYIDISTCKHTGFLNIFPDYKKFSNSVICYLCHSILKKIEVFRQQVEQNILILNKQAHHLERMKMHNLEISPIENMTITPEITGYFTKLEPEQNDEYKVALEHVKVECDMSDMESDMPLSEIKEAIVDFVKTEANTIPIKSEEAENSSLIEEQYIIKLETFLLSQEELQKERESLKVDENYLKLPFKCEKCIVGFNRLHHLKKHFNQKHDKRKGKYICGICETVLISKEALDLHHNGHFIGYQCKPCNKRYIEKRSAVSHYNEVHGKVNAVNKKYEHKTTDCEFEKQYNGSAGGSASARTHAHATHTGAPYCVACRKHFSTHSTLQQHLKHHSNHVPEAGRKFVCDECGARFIKKTYLKGHIEWAHLKKLNYRCQQCSKILKTSGSLRHHIDFVHKKKKLPRDKICDHCGKGFTTRRYLQDHIRTHTGERPYKCTQCSATFTQDASLYNHMRCVHNPLRGEKKIKREKIK